MAAPPSITALRTSAEAFAYPLPTVRQLQKQLSAELDEKNARLRTLVGGSYRELLGTAELIVDMRRDVAGVEDRLGGVAEGCGRAAVGRKIAGLAKLGPARREGSGGDGGLDGVVGLGWVACAKTLSGCVIVVGRLLKSGGGASASSQSRAQRLVVAAKVLVLSRLLLKSLANESKSRSRETEELLEDMRTKVSGLRRRLLRGVERMLQRVDGNREDLALTLSAYSLATSSGARDVLRHFLHVRGEALALAFGENEDSDVKEEDEEASVTRALSLYTKTLLDVQALAPRRLSDALLALKAKQLLNDEALRELDGLRLDMCEKWLGDEILYFTPYIRHDDLDGPQTVDTLKGWAKKASEVLLQGFEAMLEGIQDFQAVMTLRTKVYDIWIREGGKAKGFDSSIMLDGLRKVVNSRLDKLLKARVTKLHLVGTEVKATLGTWAPALNEKATSLWDDELLDMELTNGAGAFKQSIIAHVHGRNDAVSRVVTGYETWRRFVDDLRSVIEALKQQRWDDDDDIENLDDDDSLEDKNTLLSKDDPEMLLQHLETSLKASFEDLEERLATILATYQGSEHIGTISIFVLRILREIRAQLPQKPDLTSFGISLIPDLHKTLAERVSATATAKSKYLIPKKKNLLGRALWEGSPELPVQPSPATFRLLQSLAVSMDEAGSDLWSPTAIKALKHRVCTTVVGKWMTLLEASSPANTDHAKGSEKAHVVPNGNAEQADNADENIATSDSRKPAEPKPDTRGQKDLFIQSLFDFLVLKQCLLVPDTAQDEHLEKLEEHLRSRLDLPAVSSERLQQGVREYWKRTNLLFGLLS